MRGLRPAAAAALILAATAALAGGGFPPLATSASSSPDQSALLAGKGWSVATGDVSIGANRVLDVVLANPTGNTCTPVLVLRRYTNASTAQLSFQSYANPGTLSGAVTVSVTFAGYCTP